MNLLTYINYNDNDFIQRLEKKLNNIKTLKFLFIQTHM